jgi:hypothetical protein
MILQIPVTGGAAGVLATVSAEQQPQDPQNPYGGQSPQFGTMQGRIQNLTDFAGTTNKAQRGPQPPQVIWNQRQNITCLGTET